MRRLPHVLTLVLLAVGAASCAKPPIIQDPKMLANSWKCSPQYPDIVIPVELSQASAEAPCLAKVVPSGSGNPRGCRGKFVTWQVKNNCSSNLKVTIAFSPFDLNSSGTIHSGSTKGIKEMIRARARVTAASGGSCPTGTVCGPPYKYDIYIADTLVLDPELEIEP